MRVAPRVAVAWKGQVIDGRRIVEMRLFDVSSGGIGFMSPEGLRTAEALPFKVSIPDVSARSEFSDAFFTAVVTHHMLTSSGFRVGARFERIDPQALGRVQEWVYGLGQTMRPPDVVRDGRGD